MRSIILTLGVLICLFAAGPAQAGASKKHQGTADRDCSECHAAQTQAWQGGAHGVMLVTCAVCHESQEKDFRAKQGAGACRGCHAAEVSDAEAKLPAKDRTCSLCHEHHTEAVKDSAKSKAGFHGQGGGK